MSLETLMANIYNPKEKYMDLYLELELQQKDELDSLLLIYHEYKQIPKDIMKYMLVPMLKEDIDKKFNRLVDDMRELEDIKRKFPIDDETYKKMENEIKKRYGIYYE